MNRDLLYRHVYRGLQDSPQLGGCVSSPMTSLTNTLLEASLGNTPCKRLSLSSTISETPKSSCNSVSLLSVSSDSKLERTDSSSSETSPVVQLVTSLSSPRNKENLPTPYYSPTHKQITRLHQSPLRELQNTATRSLSFSPLKKAASPARRQHLSPIQKLLPPDDCDSNSRDSGYCESGQKRDGFSRPLSCAPTRRLNLDMSPKISPFKSPSEGGKGRSFASLQKKISDEDEFLMEFIGDEEMVSVASNEIHPPSSFSSLLSAPIQSSQSHSMAAPSQGPRLPIRRCLSMVDTSTPLSSKVKPIKLETSRFAEASVRPFPVAPFKRPQSPPITPNTSEAKRRKEDVSPNKKEARSSQLVVPSPKIPLSKRQFSDPEPSSKDDSHRHKFQRCHSESHLSIMKALSVSSNHNGDLTGDFSLPLSLPVISGGKHPDLKSINIHTMAALLHGKFADKVSSFKVMDCRYPYEFEGGHIATAVNWHHPSMVQEYLNYQKDPPKTLSASSPREIHIFHCEFSAERGPRAQRMLREMDRTANKEYYPALHFPELYLLEGGYKAFYESYPELCSPAEYVKMVDENHSEDLKFFRSKSKSWAAENKQGKFAVARTNPKRLGL